MIATFRKALAERQPERIGDRLWVFAPYDQLTDELGLLASLPPDEVGLVIVESPAKAARRPYHQMKIALITANLRRFALEQAERGVAVHHTVAYGSYAPVLQDVARRVGQVYVMRPAERELRSDLQGLVDKGLLKEVPHGGWLSDRAWFDASQGPDGWRMDAFYRRARQATGWLMASGKPEGGRYSFDGENRQRWPGTPAAPEPPGFGSDPVKDEVIDLVRSKYGNHPGKLAPDELPTTRADARALWDWAKSACLPQFGPYEDAMSSRARGLFHSRISPVLNLHRILPKTVVTEALDLPIPLASKEGFLRQILGWREFVHHLHEATDGFRRLPDGQGGWTEVPEDPQPGDGGWGRWTGERWFRPGVGGDGGATPSVLGAQTPLPAAWWGQASGMNCLDTVVREVWDHGWSHHITRLMVLSNVATLLDVSPRALTDWFWVAYVDAFDWVVEPNVLAMGTFGTGPVMTTKPYVSGAAYLAKMSDYCQGCAFDPKTTCPLGPMYWAFLARHQEDLAGPGRMAMPLAALARRTPEQRARDAEVFEEVRRKLLAGEVLTDGAPRLL